jgi:hypothetical protein
MLCSLEQKFTIATMPSSPILYSVYKQLVARRVSGCNEYVPQRSRMSDFYYSDTKCPFLTWSNQATAKDSATVFKYDELFDSKGQLRIEAQKQLKILASE